MIGDPNLWLWRTTWWQGKAYSIGYDTTGANFVRLYSSKDGRHFDVLVPTLFNEGEPHESSIVFDPDGTAFCLLRRDGQAGSGKLGRAGAPYTNWEWKDLSVRIGGPHLLRLPDGRLVAAVRLYDGAARTSLCWLDRGGKRVLFGQDIHGPFLPAFGSDIGRWRASMEKLLALRADILCEGHFGIFRSADQVEAYIRTYLKEHGRSEGGG